MHTSFLAVPGVPQNVRAAEISERIENDCVILVTWAPPASSNGSDIDHYIVYIPSRNIVDIESSAISVLLVPNCHDNDTIQVVAVNRFGCVGLNSSEVRPSLSFDSAQITEDAQSTQDTHGSTTGTPIGSTSTSSKY